MALLFAVCSALWLSSSLALSSRSDYAARFYMLRRGQPHVRKNRRETTKFRAQKIAIKYFCIELDCALVSTARNLWNTVIWTAHFAWPTCTVTRLSQHEHSPLFHHSFPSSVCTSHSGFLSGVCVSITSRATNENPDEAGAFQSTGWARLRNVFAQ